jgi:hypothetical protein
VGRVQLASEKQNSYGKDGVSIWGHHGP